MTLIRPRTGTSVARSIAGGLSTRATGSKGFGMLGHAGSHGRGMVTRVPGTARVIDLTVCYDDFMRTVSGGWGQADWCLPAWTSVTASRMSVNGTTGVMDIRYFPDGPYTLGGAKVEFPVGATGRTPGTIEFRMRYTGDAVSPDYPTLAWISPTDSSGATGALLIAFNYLDDVYHDPPVLSFGFTDRRSYPGGGTWESDYASSEIPLSGGDVNGWWNVSFLADDYGCYMRVWRDGEDEHVRDAATQPEDVFGVGCAQGGGETWGAWEAYSIAQYDYPYYWFRIEQDGAALAYETLEIDNLRLGQGFCPCWYVVGAHNMELCWPSEPRWGLGDVPLYGFPSGGTEVPRVLHGIPLNDDPAQTIIGPAVVGTADDWFPPDLDYPWGPVGETYPDADWQLAVMVAQQSVSNVRIDVYAWLTDSAGYEQSGTCTFVLYRNALAIDTLTASVTAGSLSYTGPINAGDKFFITYQTAVSCPGGGQQGASWIISPPY